MFATAVNHTYLYGNGIRTKLSYEEVVAQAMEQDRLVVAGMMQKPQRIIRNFTPEERQEFENGINIDDYIKAKGISAL